MDMAEYMRNQRKEIPVSVNGEMLKINANFLLKINGTLLKFNESDMESLLKFNGNMLKINAEVLKINAEMLKINALKINKNGEICEKTPFLAENPRVSGGFGGLSNVATNVGFIHHNKNQSINQIEEIGFSKKRKPKNRAEWLAMEERAKPYWYLTPTKCRKKSSFSQFAITFNKIEEDVPEQWLYLAIVKDRFDRIDEEKYVWAAHTVLSRRIWKELSRQELNSFAERKGFYESNAEKILERAMGIKEEQK